MGDIPKIVWEGIDGGQTFRAKVIGGWLIRYDSTRVANRVPKYQGEPEQWDIFTEGFLFLEDPLHQWDAQNTLYKLITNEAT